MRMIVVLFVGLSLGACVSRTPDSGSPVYLEPMSPQARADRTSTLQGNDPARAPRAANDGTAATGEPLANDTVYTGQPTPGTTSTAEAAAAYEIVEPKAVPDRPKDTGPSVAGFALSTSHPVGTPVYARRAGSEKRAARACAQFGSDDVAQAAFLRDGGPDEDPEGVDPDGDGYACSWDPQRFRQALQ